MGLTAADVSRLIAAGDPKLPAGALRNSNRNLFLEVEGEFDSAATVANTPLVQNQSGGAIRLGDIADVRRGWREPAEEIAWTNGSRSVLLGVRTDENIRLDRWAVRAREAVHAFNEQLGAGAEATIVFDQSRYTEARLSTLGGNLMAGALVVMLVVFVGMGWRAALIVGSALPLSASITVFGLGPAGQHAVVRVQPTDRVRPEHQLDPVPSGDVDVGMVLLLLGQHADAVGPGQGRAKIGELEGTREPRLRQVPRGNVRRPSTGLRLVQRRISSAARGAVLGDRRHRSHGRRCADDSEGAGAVREGASQPTVQVSPE